MSTKKKPVYSARVKIYTQDEKQNLQVELLTDTNLYRFSNMCEFIKMDCRKPTFVVSDTDVCLTEASRNKRNFCEEDFQGNNFMTVVQKVAKKYWNGSLFQIYVGSDFQAYEKILPFFCAMLDRKEKIQNNLEQTL